MYVYATRNISTVAGFFIVLALTTTACSEQVPGVVINYIPASSQIYIGSPGIAVLPNGDYIAKHDEFGPRSSEDSTAVTQIYKSSDHGATWSHLTTVKGMYWASLFVHRDKLYLMGTSRYHGDAVISCSEDGGKTWTSPRDKSSGLLLDGAMYHCAPVPIVVHQGRIWRAMEDAMGPSGRGGHFRSFMMSAPVDADLLSADSWTCSNRLGVDPDWLDGKSTAGWKAMRCLHHKAVSSTSFAWTIGRKAAVVEISNDGKKATFDANRGFIDFPGGCKKFTIRHDSASDRYWTLSNAVLPRHRNYNPERARNAVALMSSGNLRDWTIHCRPLPFRHGPARVPIPRLAV